MVITLSGAPLHGGLESSEHDAGTGACPLSSARVACRRPRLSKEAISAGLEAYQASRFEEAIALFTQALELPGSGAYRLSGAAAARLLCSLCGMR